MSPVHTPRSGGGQKLRLPRLAGGDAELRSDYAEGVPVPFLPPFGGSTAPGGRGASISGAAVSGSPLRLTALGTSPKGLNPRLMRSNSTDCPVTQRDSSLSVEPRFRCGPRVAKITVCQGLWVGSIPSFRGLRQGGRRRRGGASATKQRGPLLLPAEGSRLPQTGVSRESRSLLARDSVARVCRLFATPRSRIRSVPNPSRSWRRRHSSR
jgi:hypothetical protein